MNTPAQHQLLFLGWSIMAKLISKDIKPDVPPVAYSVARFLHDHLRHQILQSPEQLANPLQTMTTTWTPKPQPNSTSLWYIENEHGHVVQDALTERFAKQVCDMRDALWKSNLFLENVALLRGVFMHGSAAEAIREEQVNMNRELLTL